MIDKGGRGIHIARQILTGKRKKAGKNQYSTMDITEILQECSHRSKDNLAQAGRGAQLVYTRERETQTQVGNSTRLSQTTRNKQTNKN